MAIARLPSPLSAGFSLDRDNRLRFHGQGKRGRMPAAVVDHCDVRMAIRELEAAAELYAAARDMPVGSKERARTEREAANHVLVAVSFGDELLDRRRL